MKKMKLFFSFLLIFSIATISTILLTKDIETAQAAGSIQLKDNSIVLEVDHYKTLRITGTTKKAYWSSSNSRVASVSSNGKVFANHTGTATITASVGGKKLTSKVKVIYVKKAVTLTPGKTSTLTVTGTTSKVTWDSSDETIATVSNAGKVTAKAPGIATITASVDGKELTSKISVIAITKAAGFDNSPYNSAVLELNGTSGYIRKLKVIGTTSKITWTSNNRSVATVSSIGTVTAKGTGDATITTTVDGVKLTCKVKVLKISSKAFTLKVGETKKLKIYGTTSKITWLSNKETDAIVSDNGVVTAKAVGGATITGYVDGRNVTARVTIME